MRLYYTERFLKAYGNAPIRIQRTFDKQSVYLVQDIRHPSLQAKKYNEAENFWQARVNQGWRFYFKIDRDKYVLLNIIKHPK